MSLPRLLAFAAVAFLAYTLGARAGRARYRTIKKNAKTLWGSSAGRLARKTAKRGGRKLSRAITR